MENWYSMEEQSLNFIFYFLWLLWYEIGPGGEETPHLG